MQTNEPNERADALEECLRWVNGLFRLNRHRRGNYSRLGRFLRKSSSPTKTKGIFREKTKKTKIQKTSHSSNLHSPAATPSRIRSCPPRHPSPAPAARSHRPATHPRSTPRSSPHLQYYGDSSLWWVISIANPNISLMTLVIPEGVQIRIPNNFAQVVSEFKLINQLL